MRHPVLGTGTGSFQHAYSRLDPKPPLQTDDPHNEYLYIGVMLGGVGVALLIALFYTLYLSGEDLPFEHRLLVQGAAVSIAVGCMANSFILASTEGHFFAFWCAWAIAALARRERSTA
jgi:O-antigen ligase